MRHKILASSVSSASEPYTTTITTRRLASLRRTSTLTTMPSFEEENWKTLSDDQTIVTISHFNLDGKMIGHFHSGSMQIMYCNNVL